jgi:hypothetical protein
MAERYPFNSILVGVLGFEMAGPLAAFTGLAFLEPAC